MPKPSGWGLRQARGDLQSLDADPSSSSQVTTLVGLGAGMDPRVGEPWPPRPVLRVRRRRLADISRQSFINMNARLVSTSCQYFIY